VAGQARRCAAADFAGGLIATVVWTIAKYGYHGAWASYTPKSTVGIAGPRWVFAFTAYMGVWPSMFYTFDFARMGKVEQVKSNGFWVFGPRIG